MGEKNNMLFKIMNLGANLFLNATPSDNVETTDDEKKAIIELEEYLKQKIDCRQ